MRNLEENVSTMRRAARVIALVLALVLAPVLARAQETPWPTSFAPDALASYHDQFVQGIIVIRAGEPGEPLSAAAAALRQGYTQSRISSLVMDDQALGQTAGLADAEIVARVKHLPVSHVAIVRVFAGAPGEPFTAVVTIFDKTTGAVATAFSVRAGERLQPKAAPSPEPASADATQAPDEQVADTPPPPPPPDDALEKAMDRYDQEFIWFAGTLLVADNGEVLTTDVPVKGRYREPLEGARFYEAVNRPDLALRYRKRDGSRKMVGFLGVASIAGGVAASVYRFSEDETDPGVGSLVLLAGGSVLITVAFVMDPHPVPPSQARALADQHNTALRKELGLPDDYQAKPLSRARDRLRLAPFASAEGGGLSVWGQF